MSFESYYNRISTVRIEIVCAEKRWRLNILSCLKLDWSRLLKANTWKSNFLSDLYGLNLLLSPIDEGLQVLLVLMLNENSFCYYGGDKLLVIVLFLREDLILHSENKYFIQSFHKYQYTCCSFTHIIPFYYYGIFQAIFNFGLKSLEKF